MYGWQDRTLAPLEQATGPNAIRTKIACLAPNGAGKDERIIAGASHYWVGVHERGKVVITSKDSKQINQQTVPRIKAHVHKFQGYKWVDSPYFKLTTPTGGEIHAFVTNDANRLEGWHKENDTTGPLLFIINEAKSVVPAQFEAVYRCTWNALLLISSGGPMIGNFFDAFHRHRESFICIQAGLKDCPHIPDAKVQDIIRTYGEHHPYTRSTVFGEFMDSGDGDEYIVSLASLSALLLSPPRHKPGMKLAFCDFAEGRAEHTIAYRDGNKVTIAAAWRESNKEAAAGRFIREFKKLGLKPSMIWGDAADQVMLGLLREAGWPINQKNFGAPARNSEVYQSWSAEAWHELALSIAKGEVILDDDDILKAQGTTRKKTITARGKLGVEEKYDLAKRNLPSPDRWDAVAGAWNVSDNSQLPQAKSYLPADAWREPMMSSETRGVLASIGADAGF